MIEVTAGLLTAAVVTALACLSYRWLVPILLRASVDVLTAAIAAVAGALLLPEYWLSQGARSRGGAPPQIAYVYGAAIADVSGHAQQITRRLCLGLAKAAARANPVLVAVAAAGLSLLRIFFSGS